MFCPFLFHSTNQPKAPNTHKGTSLQRKTIEGRLSVVTVSYSDRKVDRVSSAVETRTDRHLHQGRERRANLLGRGLKPNLPDPALLTPPVFSRRRFLFRLLSSGVLVGHGSGRRREPRKGTFTSITRKYSRCLAHPPSQHTCQSSNQEPSSTGVRRRRYFVSMVHHSSLFGNGKASLIGKQQLGGADLNRDC